MRASLLVVLGACSFSAGRLPAAGGDGGPDDNARDATTTGGDASDAAAVIQPDAMADAMADARTCPVDYVTLAGGQSGKHYKRYEFAAGGAGTYAKAQQTCASENSYVGIPDGAAELGAFEAVSQDGNAPGYWIGVTDLVTEGSWVTELGVAAIYLPWKPAPNPQPNGGTLSNCVVGSANELWDVDCANPYPFTCECDL